MVELRVIKKVKEATLKAFRNPTVPGLRYGRFEVLEEDNKRQGRQKKWICLCDCGNLRSVAGGNLRNGSASSCGCISSERIAKLGRKIDRSSNNHPRFSGFKDLPRTYYSRIILGASQRGIEFNISMEDIWDVFEQQNRKCALTGLPITFYVTSGKKKTSLEEMATASVDRIDSSKGYIKGNIQILHKDINKMKWDFPQEKVIKLCKLVASYNV